MKRLIASLIIALLLSPASASAECAWVLWSESWVTHLGSMRHAPSTWEPVSATETADECEKARVERSERLLKRGISSQLEGQLLKTVISVCFPDTVDPRGPKGTK